MSKPSEQRVMMFQSFMADTTIHGLRYIPDGSFHRLANIFWLAIEVLAFGLGIYLILAAFETWAEKPVLTTVDSVAYPLYSIYFPTITFCVRQKQPSVETWAMVNAGLDLIRKAFQPENEIQ